MNTKSTKTLVLELNVKPLIADITHQGEAPEATRLLVELGNTKKSIPYLVIYPGDGREPIIFDGPILQGQVIDALNQAGPSRPQDQTVTSAR